MTPSPSLAGASEADRVREALAQHIDPDAFALGTEKGLYWSTRRLRALSKADGTLAGPLAPILSEHEALCTRAAEAEKERDEQAAIITAWEGAASGLEAHLQDRIAMRDEADPATYLSIWRTDFGDLTKRSRQIYAASQHRAAEGHRQALKAESVAEGALRRSRLANARADAAEARVARLDADKARLHEALVGLDQRIWTDPQEIERAGEWRTFIARALTTAKGDADT